MPDVRMPNGTVIRNVPAGTTKAQLVAKLERNGFDLAALTTPKQKENALEKMGPIGNAAAWAADIPLSFVEGLAGSAKTFTDAFGADNAASGFLGDVSRLASDWKSSESRQDAKTAARVQQEAEGKGIWEEVKAAAKAFTYSPLETTAGLIGSSVPYIGAAVGATALAPETGGASLAALYGLVGGGAAGAISGAGMIKGDIYDAMYEVSLEHGASEEQAKVAAEKAQEYAGPNTDQIALGSLLGAAAAATGLPRQISSSIARRAEAELANRAAQNIARKSVAKGAIVGGVEEAIPEAVQAGQERYAQNVAQQRAGYDVDPFAGVAGQAAFEGIASLIPGIYGGRKETIAKNRDSVNKALEEEFEALPVGASQEEQSAAVQRFVQRGFPEDVANRVVERLAAEKDALEDRKAAAEEMRRASVEVRTAGIEDPTSAPVYQQEEAARQRFYEQESGAAPAADEFAYTSQTAAARATQMSDSELDLRLEDLAKQDASTLAQEERLNANAIRAEKARRTEAAQATQATPDAQAAPAFSRAQARKVIDDLSDAKITEEEAEYITGLSMEEIYSIADDVTLPYSRRGRPAKSVDTATPDMFAGEKLGTAPTKTDKREEYNDYRFASEEDKAARQEQFEQERKANEERAAIEQKRLDAARQQRDADREETLGDIEYALRAQAPENAVYKVVYDPTSNSSPYKLVAETQLGKKPEEVIKATTLKDFSAQVYGRMMQLTPFTPETAFAVDDVERIKRTEQEAPTAATRMVQDFVKEVDAAREAGQIDNNQRSQLLARLERPDAYRRAPNGTLSVPNDAIAVLEAEALDAVSIARNAPAAEKKAAEAAAKEANQKLRAAVKNSLLNPARATLKSMVEMRQDEKTGAKQRIGDAKVQARLGEMEGADTKAEQNEIIDAKIDLAEQRVSRYRRKQAAANLKAADVQAVVDKIAPLLKGVGKVVVVQSVSDITDRAVRRAIQRDGAIDANGLVAPDGTIYLIADNLTSKENAKAVLFHEALGHVGLTKLFRDSLDRVLTSLYEGNAALRAQTDKWRQSNSGAYANDANPLARAVEEVLAERSEAGPMNRSFFQKLAAVVRDFARRMGFNLAISDGDVNAILDMAHQQALYGEGSPSSLKGVRYAGLVTTLKYSRPKTKPTTADELIDSEADMSDGLRRTLKSTSTYGIADGLGQAIKGRDFKAFLNALKENYEGLTPAALKASLVSMPTSGIINWFNKDIPNLREIDALVRDMANMKANIIKAADPIAKLLDQFLLTDTEQRLATAQSIFRINELAPEELKDNRVVAEIERRILDNTNNRTLANQLIAEIKSIVMANKGSKGTKKGRRVMSAKLADQLKQLTKIAIDNTKTTEHVEQLAEMTRRIRDSQQAWDKLGELKNGHKLYKGIRDFYKDMFSAELALLDARIEKLTDEKEAKRLKDLRADMMRAALDPKEAKKAGDVLYNIDSDLFAKDYFPFMREGKYWVRVAGDEAGDREREFYTFESALERNRAVKKIAKRLGVDAKDSSVITQGDDIADLQEDLKSEDLMMQKVFELVSKAKLQFETVGVSNLKDLTDSIYQTWLLSTPERSVRRRFMHADEVVGFQQDVLRQFSGQVTSYATQLSKMAYAGDIRTAVSAANDRINDSERPNDERAKLNSVVSEMSKRAEQEINPDPQNAIVNMLNRASYFYYLTSARTALIQTVSIPLRVLPRLWRDYGFSKGSAKYVQYMQLWKTLGNTRVETIKTGLGDQLHALMPSITGSKLFSAQTDRGALLRRALEVGMRSNALETVANTLVQNEREAARKHKKGVVRTVSVVAGETAKVTSVLFQGMENISRQAAYFMTFELAYDDYKAKNPQADEKQVFDHAVEKALSVTRDTLGDYSSFERPSIAKSNVTRALFLFKMYPIVQTKFMVGAMRDIYKGTVGGATAEDKAERAGAMKELAGVLMMAGVFGGVMGMPIYSLIAYALAQSFDEEDDDDVRALMGLDPRTAYDSDIMFRKWMSDTFGTPQVGDVDLADVLTYGPIAALTNTELASSTSLDLKNMWFREAVAGDSTFDSIFKTAMANIAGGQMLIQGANASDNFANGDIYGGLKKSLPAFARTWVSAAQGTQEGVETTKGDTIISKNELTELDTMRSLIGFRPLRLSQWQDYYITRSKNEKEIDGEKKQILDTLERKLREGDIKTEEDFQAYLEEEVVPFNRTYPDPSFMINMDTITSSMKRRAEIHGRTVRGMQLEKKTAQKDYDAARAFRLE